jgi:glycosyltransferase involved in cell wall biosynthesis
VAAPEGIAVKMVRRENRERAFADCDAVIALAPELPFAASAAHAEHGAQAALVHGRALLAADAPAHRDLSPEGRGLLWFRPGDPRDLAHRAIFLARNPDMRRVLGDSGRRMLLATRAPAALAQQYDSIYKHAWTRRRSTGLQPPFSLQPMTACI